MGRIIPVDRVVHLPCQWARLTEIDEVGCVDAGNGRKHFCVAKVKWYSEAEEGYQRFRATYDGFHFSDVRVASCWGRRYPKVLHIFLEIDENSKIEVEATERLF